MRPGLRVSVGKSFDRRISETARPGARRHRHDRGQSTVELPNLRSAKKAWVEFILF